MTAENPWNPHTVQLKAMTTEQRELHIMNDGVNVKSVNITARPDEEQFVNGHYDPSTLTLAAVSSALTPETLIPRIISKVQIATVYDDERHEDGTSD